MESLSEIPGEVEELSPYISKLMKRLRIAKLKNSTNPIESQEEFVNNILKSSERLNSSNIKIATLNIPALLAGVVNFERYCRSTCRFRTKTGFEHLPKDVMLKLKRENYSIFVQFISSNFSTNYKAMKVE